MIQKRPKIQPFHITRMYQAWRLRDRCNNGKWKWYYFLSKLVQAEGKVFAFDIQEAALIKTTEKIQT